MDTASSHEKTFINAYGSFIEEEELENSEKSPENTGLPENVERVIKCCCKGMCFKRTGPGACICKENNQKCGLSCACDKAKCTNSNQVQERLVVEVREVNEESNNSDDSDESGTSSDEENTEQVEETKCDCKGMCAKKTGRGACICKTKGQTCNPSCSCNKSKCKNWGGIERMGPQPEDGHIRFEQQLVKSQEEIEGFVAGLDAAKKDTLLVSLLSIGRGSMDFAKKLLEGGDQYDIAETSVGPDWCKCKKCCVMPDEQENLCCKRVTCVTAYNTFSNICLDKDVLEVCIKARCDLRCDDFDFSLESFRKAAYRQFALWRYGKLGRGNRKVILSCVVLKIREIYPSPDGQYMGFRLH